MPSRFTLKPVVAALLAAAVIGAPVLADDTLSLVSRPRRSWVP